MRAISAGNAIKSRRSESSQPNTTVPAMGQPLSRADVCRSCHWILSGDDGTERGDDGQPLPGVLLPLSAHDPELLVSVYELRGGVPLPVLAEAQRAEGSRG